MKFKTVLKDSIQETRCDSEDHMRIELDRENVHFADGVCRNQYGCQTKEVA